VNANERVGNTNLGVEVSRGGIGGRALYEDRRAPSIFGGRGGVCGVASVLMVVLELVGSSMLYN